MKPFVINRRGRVVLPSNFVPDLDFSVIEDVDQLDRVIRRDFETKAPTGTDILRRIETVGYPSRYELLRDVALNLFWVNRFAITMYDKRPVRWGDLPRTRDDVFLPVATPWEDAERKTTAVESCYRVLPPSGDGAAEDEIFRVLFDVFRHRRHHATDLAAIEPTVGEIAADPANRTFALASYDPDYPVYGFDDIIECRQEVAELEALHRWAMVLHNQYPWDRSQVRLAEVGSLRDDDFVIAFYPANRDVLDFVRRVRRGTRRPAPAPRVVDTRPPIRPFPPVEVRSSFGRLPRLEALAVVKGEHSCTNDDLIRNAAYSWSPMTAQEVCDKTGIERRCYTARRLEDIALEAADAALAHAGRAPEEIGAVLFCSCTSTRLIPSVATWLSGQLGMHQTHVSCDLVAACAGMPYGLAEATRLLQEVDRPVLVVCAEKFSDKIGTVRPSRMIFGDGAAALVVGVVGEGEAPDIEVLQTYASGPVSEVNAIIWPNPEFDNNITVYGPEVRALVKRYLGQMIEELRALPDPDGVAASLLESIDLVVPHQANKTMVTSLATAAGLSADQLYFDIESVGNLSAASIPVAIYDAVREKHICAPVRVFAPGFGAGAVGGYAVLGVDPAVVSVAGERSALAQAPAGVAAATGTGEPAAGAAAAGAGATTTRDVAAAFGP